MWKTPKIPYRCFGERVNVSKLLNHSTFLDIKKGIAYNVAINTKRDPKGVSALGALFFL